MTEQITQALYYGETEAKATVAFARSIVELMVLFEDCL